MKNANTKSRVSSVSKSRARLLTSWAAVIALAVSLLFVELLTGCTQNQPSAVDQTSVVDPADLFRTDGHGKITGYKCAKEELPANLVIPAKIGDEVIKEIGSNAFYYCTKLTSISLPESLTQINIAAFSGCTGLTSVSLPANLIQIGSSAFSHCTGLISLTIDSANATYKTEDNILYNKDGSTLIFAAGGLTSVNILNTVTTIGDHAFFGCTGLTSISLPANLTTIDEFAFFDCTSLTSISLPANLIQIGSQAFYGCTGLTSVSLPASLTQIAHSAFYGCTGLTNLTIDSANTTYKTEGNILYNKAGTKLILPAGGLTSVNILNTVTTIGEVAFYGCTGLTSVSLPASLTQIAHSAFYGCTGLTNLTIDSANTTYKTEGNILYNKAGTTLILSAGGLTSVNILNTVTTIGDYAFCDCTGLTSISLPASLTTISNSAFCGCTGLTSISLPANLTQIDDHAFSRCTGLTSVSLPASLTQIGWGAFYDCTGLTSVIFADKNGWKVYDNNSYSGTSTPISSSDLDNAATAAKYLRKWSSGGGYGGYTNKWWKKN